MEISGDFRRVAEDAVKKSRENVIEPRNSRWGLMAGNSSGDKWNFVCYPQQPCSNVRLKNSRHGDSTEQFCVKMLWICRPANTSQSVGGLECWDGTNFFTAIAIDNKL